MITDTEHRHVLLAAVGSMLVRLGKSWPGSSPLVNAAKAEDLMRSWLQCLGQRSPVARPDQHVYGSAPSATGAVVLLEKFHERPCRPTD